ncbi:hypothetical protein, partial [Klebsiella pneumoniae]|uniref:hypothetical protein n=1 Tax=Klebsiella pneumoniae TaxID=573 RepID=UPI002162F4AF
ILRGVRQQQDEPGRFSICSRQAAVVLNSCREAFDFSYSNSNILIGLIRCFYERLMLLTIFAARLICINLEFDIVFPVIKSFEFWS